MYAVSIGCQGMQRTQIYLSEQERQGLQALALRSGRSQSAINRRAAWRGCVRAGACGPIAKTCPAGLSLARARPPALLVVDTDVLIDVLRDQADAVAFLEGCANPGPVGGDCG